MHFVGIRKPEERRQDFDPCHMFPTTSSLQLVVCVPDVTPKRLGVYELLMALEIYAHLKC